MGLIGKESGREVLVFSTPGGELGAARYPYPYFYPYPRWRVGAARESDGAGEGGGRALPGRACEGENDG